MIGASDTRRWPRRKAPHQPVALSLARFAATGVGEHTLRQPVLCEHAVNGIILFGLGNEVKIFIAGFILASVVLYEAYVAWKRDKIIGQRPELMKELNQVQ